MASVDEGIDLEKKWYSFTYASDEMDQPSIAIVEAIGWIEGVDSCALPPLADSIDPVALNELFTEPVMGDAHDPGPGRSPPDDLRVRFEYDGFVVTVSPDRIRVGEAD